MMASLQTLYVELESIDLNLILSVELGNFSTMRDSLDRRRHCLDKLVQHLADGRLVEVDRDAIYGLQNSARARHDRLLEIFGGLRNEARQVLLKTAGPRRGVSPYARLERPGRRTKA